jgi:lipopolysaccharide transport system ATP-binding protein
MSGDAVIHAEKLGKKYSIRHRAERERYATFRDALAGGFRGALRSAGRLTRGERPIRGASSEEFWALTNLDFEVRRGEVLGVIGRNGAGKSTLLKILSRITEPSAGRVTMAGRVASLLEVGTGFHPELTGRENVYLNGAVLGMTRSEVRRRFDEIVDFAGVGQFLDTPVKRYSSGMYVRLAFAVAAHLEQEILVVDEVLAVGDAEFQRKCIGKMDEISRKDGRTVLVVTHNMGLVTSLCSTAIWIDEGTVCARGAARLIVSKYLAKRMPAQMQNVPLAHLPRSQSVEDDRLRFDSIEWLCDLPLQHGKPFGARITRVRDY